MKSLTRKNWQDLYYDGQIDVEYEVFDEERQRIHRVKKNYNDECWGKDSYNVKNEKYIEDNNMSYLLRLKRGEIKRIR